MADLVTIAPPRKRIESFQSAKSRLRILLERLVVKEKLRTLRTQEIHLTARSFFRLPLSGEALGLVNLRRRHLLRDQVSILETHGVTAGAGQVKPHIRLNIVLRDTLALGVHDAEIGPRFRLSLVRSQEERAEERSPGRGSVSQGETVKLFLRAR
jgi:hypothetical protein